MIYILFFLFSCFQSPVLAIVPLPTLLYFHCATKKDWHRSRAWWKSHQKQFTGTQVLVQHLEEGMTSTLLTMLIAAIHHTQSLVTPTLSQVEYKTASQSWLGLTVSHLMTGKYFTLPRNPLANYHCPHKHLYTASTQSFRLKTVSIFSLTGTYKYFYNKIMS